MGIGAQFNAEEGKNIEILFEKKFLKRESGRLSIGERIDVESG